MPELLTLFDDFIRTNPMPSGAVESDFDFLNRVDQPFWNRIRVALEDWFSAFPIEHQTDLRARFRKSDANQHWPAWWELYLHNLFCCLGFEVTVHPDLAEGGTHPDFLLSRGGKNVCYVEAVCSNTGAIISDGRHAAREGRLIDIINEVPHGGFHASLTIEQTGPRDLPKKHLKGCVEGWMTVLKECKSDDDWPVLWIDRDDWRIRLAAVKTSPRTGRGPLISIGPVITGMMDDIGTLRRTVDRKRGHYPIGDTPMALAIFHMGEPSDEDCIDRLIHGDRIYGAGRDSNGIWGTDPECATGWPDALIVGTTIYPWTVAKYLPVLVPAPGREQLTADIDLPQNREAAKSVRSAADLLGLPNEWPGPEKNFEGLW